MKILNTIGNFIKLLNDNKINSEFNTSDNTFDILNNMFLDEKIQNNDKYLLALKNYVLPEQITLTSENENISVSNLSCYVIGNFVFISGIIRTLDELPAGIYNINFSKNLRPKMFNIFQDYQQCYEGNLYRNRYLIERTHPERLRLRSYDIIPNNCYFGVNLVYKLDDYARHE